MKRVLPAALVLLCAVPALAQVRAGGEFQVNTYVTGSQSYPSVALGPAGDFVIVWEDGAGQDGSGFGIFGQRYDAAGLPRGSAFQVNTVTLNSQFMPSVAGDPRGGFIVAWSSFAGSTLDIAAQRYDPAGKRVGGEFRVNTDTAMYHDSPVMAFDRAGNFVVAWVEIDGDSLHKDIVGRRYDAAGAPLGGQFLVNSYTTGRQLWPSVAREPAGGFVIVWSSDGQDGSYAGSFGQRFDAAGNRVGGEFRANALTLNSQDRPTVAMADDGRFVVSWMGFDGSGLGPVARLFAANGNPRGADFILNTQTANQQFFPSVASDTSGDFTVAWTSYSPGPAGFDMVASRFDPNGLKRGSDFLVNTFTPGDQYVTRYAPTLASDPSGNFVVVWTSRGQDGSGYGVFAQRFGGLVPASLAVDQDPGHDGVLEPGETVSVRPSWRNVNGAAQAVTGTVTELTGPAGATYTITDGSGSYGTLASGAIAPCTDCYAISVSAPAGRPATHWDAVAVEKLAPDAQGQVARWPLHVGESFADVPSSSAYHRFVETLLHRGVTAGCNATQYCPAAGVTREQMAAFVLVSKEGFAYLPPACAAPSLFDDVPASSPFCRWVEELARRGVVSGCGPRLYCPGDAVTREQMAVFLLRTLDPALSPPACAPPNTFADVPETSAYCRWIEELARRGITGGCGGANYCPTAPVARDQMAVFLTVTFALSL